MAKKPGRKLSLKPSKPSKPSSTNRNGSLMPVRILVVDDLEPFRRFVCSTLGQRPDWQIVGEASNGLEAVQKAEELQPHLIVLDIGLPGLHGIEVARRIRYLSPKSRIIFATQESSVDVMQEALSIGALGYVIKLYAERELVAAVEAVLQRKRFVSSVLTDGNGRPHKVSKPKV